MNRMSKTWIPILSVLCVLSAVVMVIALCQTPKAPEFVPPEFDSEAIAGTPDAPKELGWSELHHDKMSFRVGLCGNVVLNDGTADVYFSSAENNEVWLKLRVLDENGNILCETGLIKPNEYIKSIRLDTALPDGSKIRLKIMAYEPETYYSAGSVVLNAILRNGG